MSTAADPNPPVATPQPVLDALAALDQAKADDAANAALRAQTAAALASATDANNKAVEAGQFTANALASAKQALKDAVDANY